MCDLNKISTFNTFNHKNPKFNSQISNNNNKYLIVGAEIRGSNPFKIEDNNFSANPSFHHACFGVVLFLKKVVEGGGMEGAGFESRQSQSQIVHQSWNRLVLVHGWDRSPRNQLITNGWDDYRLDRGATTQPFSPGPLLT